MKRFWGWELATYLFLGGLGGGILTFAMVLGLIVYPEEELTSTLLVWGVFMGVVCLALGCLLLIFELGQPKLFYRAFVTKTAVIKWGAVLLSISLVFGALFLVWEITWFDFLPFIPYEGLAKFFLGVSGVSGFGVMVYTGTMISSLKGRPFWATPALPVLFTVSASSTGAAALSMSVGFFPLPIGWLQYDFRTVEGIVLAEEMQHLLHTIDAVLIILELTVLLLYVLLQFCASNRYAKAVAERWVRGSWAPLFWGCMVCGGLVLPFFCNVLGGSGFLATTVSPVLALCGGLLLRFLILYSCERRLDNGEEKYYTRLPQEHAAFMDYWEEGRTYWEEVEPAAAVATGPAAPAAAAAE